MVECVVPGNYLLHSSTKYRIEQFQIYDRVSLFCFTLKIEWLYSNYQTPHSDIEVLSLKYGMLYLTSKVIEPNNVLGHV